VKSFRLPPPKEGGVPSIEMDIFQGDSEFIIDNEYLGTVRVPASATGKRIDFRLNEECLLKVVVEEGAAAKVIALATRDTPESLRRALAEETARRQVGEEVGENGRGGLFSSLRRMLGRG